MLKAINQHAAAKSILGVVLMLAAFSVIAIYAGLQIFTDETLEQYSAGAFQTARSAAQIVDANHMDDFVQSGGTGEEYEQAYEQLDYLCNASGSTFIYVIQPDLSDYAHITFIFSTINHLSKYSVYDFGYVRETTNDEYREKYSSLYHQLTDTELVVRDKGYIETDPHITAMVPLKDSNRQVKGILCVQRQLDVLANARMRFLGNVLLAFAALALLFIVGHFLFLNKTLLKPLKQISEEATRFATENVPATTKLTDVVKNTDEVGQLAASVDTMEEQVHDYVNNLMEITAEKERLSTELDLASRIQASMLPNIFPAFPERDELDVYASMSPAKEVGGDFFDFFFIDKTHLGMAIADVSGKGVPAALFMMISKTLVQNLALLGNSPKDVLELANAQILKNNDEDMFITMWVGVLDLATGKLVAANAGHEFPVFKQGDKPYELMKDPHGVAVGVIEGSTYTEYEVQLQPGDRLFVYTDGVPEATNADEELFGLERMMDVLHTLDDESPEQVLEAMRTAVGEFVSEAPQFDDLTMLCLHYLKHSES